ncbi:methyltransferase domain-containing protein [Zhongshania sp. BJYM1]|uniref:methyltransferase domain-containing protein n=1 Tax=Zhongshania aquatica TaxID=2965069 RepID=UPI0022B35814|nr:methyltransferase domain-containing protein [Marortus sp. BJYM1]
MKRSNSTTERLFRSAGISEGMKVLELGSGPGEISELLSDIVGPAGSVLAIDRSEDMISFASKSLEKSGRSNVRFLQADLNDAPKYLESIDLLSFDAVVGRRVLMYLPRPDRVLSSLLPWLREGGLVVFEEHDSTICPGFVTAMPAHERGVSLLEKMLAEEGVDTSMGFHLPATFSKAGLKFEAIWAEAVIDGQGDQYSLGELLELLKSRMESSNVAVASEIDELIAQIEIEREPTTVFVSGMRFCSKAIKR